MGVGGGVGHWTGERRVLLVGRDAGGGGAVAQERPTQQAGQSQAGTGDVRVFVVGPPQSRRLAVRRRQRRRTLPAAEKVHFLLCVTRKNTLFGI